MARFMHGGVVGARLLAPSIEFVHNAVASGTTITQSGLDFGDAIGGRNEKWGLVICVYLQTGATVSITSASICGQAASVVYTNSVARGPSTVRAVYSVFAARIDGETTGDVVFTDNSSANVRMMVARVVNLDCSATTHTAIAANAAASSLATSCNAGGGIIAFGEYVTLGTPVSGTFNGLDELHHAAEAAGGYTLGGTVFPTAQTGLNVGYNASGFLNKSEIALSFAGVS